MNHIPRSWLIAAVLIAVAALILPLFAQDQAEADAPPKKSDSSEATDNPGGGGAGAGREWHTVKAEEFVITATLDGVFEAEQMHAVELAPKEWQALKVVEAVAPGAKVSKGDLLLRLETEKIDRAIRDAELALSLAELSLSQNQQELAVLERTTPLDLAAAERAYDRAREDHKRFVEIEFGLSLKSAEMSLQSSSQSLQYAQEELNQLEKMYREDELTEETEEIILKRQRWAVERALFSNEQAIKHYEEVTTMNLPRRKQDAELALERTTLGWDKARVQLPLALEQKRKLVEKMSNDYQQAKDKLARLQADRSIMELRSPADGVVYYGECVNGKWPGVVAMRQSLRPGSSLKSGTVVMTIVSPEALIVRTSVSEKQLTRVPAGAEAAIMPTAFPNLVLKGAIAGISPVPTSEAGSHDVTAKLAEKPASIVAGMTCRVKIEAYRNDEAIVVPLTAVEADDNGDWHVKVRGDEDEAAAKRAVKLGWRSDTKVEVLEGLAAGDKVQLIAAASGSSDAKPAAAQKK